MARQSLYELLGLTDKASPDDIRQAFVVVSAALAVEPDGEDKRNRLTFLIHARDTLLDPRTRALHDRELWSEKRALASALVRVPPKSNQRWIAAGLLGLLLVLVVRLVGNRQAEPRDLPIASAKRSQPIAPASLPRLADIAAQLPEREIDVVADPAPVAPAVSPGPKAEPMPIHLMVPSTAVFDKIADATYAIVGTQTMGTGVAIEKDRLLTNCHVLAPNVLKGKIFAISARTRERFEITQAAFLVKDDACVALAPGLTSQPINIGETRALRPGARFHNLGFADGTLTLADGVYLGSIVRSQQSYLISTNYCVPGVSGGALVDEDGRLLGITSGSTPDHRFCASLTAETARSVLTQSMIPIDAFPGNYLTNFKRRW
ncbi:MAG: trypsin-like peptidase domain-containing protein [Rhodocyclaceae bacterium]|nr:trypsin-like peptidase domain-containing protein [Rhodocyclaceae bacterium]